MAGGVIAAHPPHLGAQALQFAVAVTEGAGLHRASRGVVFRIEKQHQGPAVELIAAAFHPILIAQGNGGGEISSDEGHGMALESVGEKGGASPNQSLGRDQGVLNGSA